ncbi:MAG TPA: iron ABC transporter permease [Steroidobacter sp.]|uniref:ABC transporter permease n=1 Tax=Steroidobacter sp. TaxID=1978227 RepID=UPI002ED8DBAB
MRDSLPRALVIQYLVAAATLLLVAAPLLPILLQSFSDRPLYDGVHILSLDNYRRLLTDPHFYAVTWNSLRLAFWTTVIALVLGVGMTLLIERTNIACRRLLRALMLSPLYISHLVIAFGWFVMYGPSGYVTQFFSNLLGYIPWNLYSIGGMSVVAGTAQASLVYLFCSSSAAMADSSLEDAARSTGATPMRVLCSISLPLMRPAIIYSALLNFIGSLEMLSVPLVFGRPVGYDFFTTYLYREGLHPASPDYGLVGAAAAMLLVLISLLLVLQGRLLARSSRFITVKGKASRPKLTDIGNWRVPACALLLCYLIVVLGVPVLGLALRSFTAFLTPLMAPWELLTLDNYRAIFGYEAYVRSIWNSVIISVVGGAIGVALIATVALVVHRSDFRFRRPLEFVALYPRAIPGVVAGLGIFWATLLLGFMAPLQGTIWILMIAFIIRSIPTAYGALAPALLQIGREFDQSARSAGADWWTACTRIIAPILKPALFSAYVLLFLAFMKEYSSAAFLYAPGSEVIGTVMLSFWTNGDAGPVAALSLIQMVITFAFVYVARRVLRSSDHD